MDTPTGRPVVCSECGKVNRHSGHDCVRCGVALAGDADGGADHSKTSPGRKRLVTRQSEDGSLEMVQLSPEEAAAEEIDISRGLTGEHELVPPDAEAGASDPRRNRILFGAVASAALLVALLAWPFAGSDSENEDAADITSAGDTGPRGEGPRVPKLPPPPPPEPVKAKTKATASKLPTAPPTKPPPPSTVTDSPSSPSGSGSGSGSSGKPRRRPAATGVTRSEDIVSPGAKDKAETPEAADGEEGEEEGGDDEETSDDEEAGEGEGEAEESDDDEEEE